MKKPYVIINCAMSADGKIALPTRVQTRISNEEDMRRVHNLRNQCDAVLVGINTILADNPKLIVKKEYVKKPVKLPIRIVVDSKCKIPADANVLDGSAKTIIACAKGFSRKINNAEVIECGEGKVDLKQLLDMLAERNIQRILVEGGGTVIWSFLKERLADELNIFIGSVVIGGKTSPTPADGTGVKRIEDAVKLKLKKIKTLGNGILLQYKVLR